MLAFDTVGSNTGVAATTTMTWAHVVGTGATLLTVAFGGYSDNAMTVSSVKIGTTDLVHLGGQGLNAVFNDFQDIWYLINPPAGSATITVKMDQTVTTNMSGGSTSWFGSDLTTPLINFATTFVTSATISTTVTTTPGNVVEDFYLFASSTETASNNSSNLAFNNNNHTFQDAMTGSSYNPTSAGSTTLTWTITESKQNLTCGWEIVAGSGSTSTQTIVGLAHIAASGTQFAYPSADSISGLWTPSTGTSLFNVINHQGDDGDYIQSSLIPSSDMCDVKITSLNTPSSKSDHIVTFIYRCVTGLHVNLTVGLYQDTTLIASQTVIPTTSDIQGSFLLSEAQANAISDYTKLHFRFTANTI